MVRTTNQIGQIHPFLTEQSYGDGLAGAGLGALIQLITAALQLPCTRGRFAPSHYCGTSCAVAEWNGQ